MDAPIYLDNHATTPLDPKVLEAMLPYYQERFGNAASKQHSFGWVAEEAVENAREQIASLIGAKSKEITFTSGATESNNLAIFGAAQTYAAKGKHVITVATEHKSVLDPMAYLQKNGFELTSLSVDREGNIDIDRLQDAITDKTILISVMAANNEIGTIPDLAVIGKIAKEKEIFFHSDAAQAVAKIPIDVQAQGIDLLSLTAHKLYGPKGIGALYVRSREPNVRLTPQQLGGGHERGLRSGTLPVPICVGLGKACEIARQVMPQEAKATAELRDRLYDGIMQGLDDVFLNGDPKKRLPNNLNLSFVGCKAEALMMKLDTIACSSGSACTTADPKPSHVLRALGIGDDLAHASLRFGIGRFNTAAEIDTAIEKIIAAVKELRA